MIDIWMLFTIIVPFLEVVLHTTKDVFKKSRSTPPCLKKKVGVVNVRPAEDQGVEEAIKNDNHTLNLIASLMLPVSSLIFAFVFWMVGLIASNPDGNHTDPNMLECLAVQSS